jgi:hypothetical protein
MLYFFFQLDDTISLSKRSGTRSASDHLYPYHRKSVDYPIFIFWGNPSLATQKVIRPFSPIHSISRYPQKSNRNRGQ